jgi:hypothetical protein
VRPLPFFRAWPLVGLGLVGGPVKSPNMVPARQVRQKQDCGDAFIRLVSDRRTGPELERHTHRRLGLGVSLLLCHPVVQEVIVKEISRGKRQGS